MNDNQELTRFIQKLHLRTFDKIWPHVKEKYGDEISTEQVKEILKTLIRDPKHLNQKQYYNKIFSDHLHAWMCDLLDNSGQNPDYNNKAEKELHETTKEYPIYWFIFININTRFAAAYPLYHKTVPSILDKLQQFVREHKCVSLTSDKESAFISQDITKYLKGLNISQYIVLDNNHTSLSIMDSFIRHLRDMNITNEKSKYQSYHSKYRNFSTHRMKELINIYNNTIHSTIKMKPIEMENDEKKERQYIAYCLIRRSKTKSHDIPTGHFVRIVLSKDLMKKRRYKVSREVYKISGRDGKNYFISAADNSTTSLPRHRLIDIGNETGKYKFAETIPFVEGFRVPTKIINRQRGERKYMAEYGNDGYGEIREVDLRRHHPQIQAPIEKQYHEPTTIRLNVPPSNTIIRLNLNHQ